MNDNARCECGSRIFLQRPTLVTTASGTIRDIPSVMVMECVTCSRTYITTTDAGKKTLKQFKFGAEAERELFRAALDSWKNTDKPETNESLIVTEDADKADFERLGIK